MSAPVVILPPSAAVGIEARSKVERQALFHIASTGLWARNGVVVRLSPVLDSLILALAAARGRTLAYGAAIDAVHGDDPEGGPLDPIGSFNVMRSRASGDFAALGIEVGTWQGCGYALNLRRLRTPGAPPRNVIEATNTDPYWASRARAMRERGATSVEIARAVNRSDRQVRNVLHGYKTSGGGNKPSTRSKAAQKRCELRAQARVEAVMTGEPVEQIYARWGCETVDRSRLWDQRRAAAQSTEARS